MPLEVLARVGLTNKELLGYRGACAVLSDSGGLIGAVVILHVDKTDRVQRSAEPAPESSLWPVPILISS